MVKFTKKQHYIPKCLLKNFINSEGKIFEIFLSLGKEKIYPTSPEESMCRKFTYETPELKENSIEKFFSKIETKLCPLFKEILTLIEDYKNGIEEFQNIKKKIHEIIPDIITLYYRSGALLREFSTDHEKYKILRMLEKILNNPYIILLAETIRESYDFAIIESNNDFLISDQFISTSALKIKNRFDRVSNRNIGLKETLLLIPISSKYYVVFWHTNSYFFIKKDHLNIISNENVNLINRTIINNSYEKCVGSKKEILEKSIKNYHKGPTTSQIFIEYNNGYHSGAIIKKEVFFYEEDQKAYKFFNFNTIPLWKYLKAKLNAPCPCGSQKHYKKCHKNLFERVKIPIQNLINQKNIRGDIYKIPNARIVEEAITEWGGY